MLPDSNFKMIPRRALAERNGVSTRTVARWERDFPGFPKSVVINHRHYTPEPDVIAFEKQLISKGLAE